MDDKFTGQIHFADNLSILQNLTAESVDLIYIDPPFNTGKTQSLNSIGVTRSEDGDRVGFGGQRYATTQRSGMAFTDNHTDYLGFLKSRLCEAYRVLASHGTLYIHLDSRESANVRVKLLDEIFGPKCFLNEIIWAYDYGGRGKNRWPTKHDNILVYVKSPNHYTFNWDAIERIPYMTPGLVGPEKAARGKVPTDVWWMSVIGTNSHERTDYPTQKPVALLKRIVQASSNPEELVLDFFAGSGTTGAACLELDRKFILIDNNPEAIAVMRERFKGTHVIMPMLVNEK